MEYAIFRKATGNREKDGRTRPQYMVYFHRWHKHLEAASSRINGLGQKDAYIMTISGRLTYARVQLCYTSSMDIRPHRRREPIERFLALIQINPGGCWEWLGSRNKKGYGQFSMWGGRGARRYRIGPHRFIWEFFNGPMSEGLEADHTCFNPGCVNPEHIEPVTHAENMRRSIGRSRRPCAKLPRPTHCPHGHEYTPENSKLTAQNTVQCKACNRARCFAYQSRRKTAARLSAANEASGTIKMGRI